MNVISKNIWWIVGILILFIIGVFLYVLHTKPNLGDLDKYPFAADVWGTFSDWIMVIVTGITAWFLYQTLKSQTEVQKDQRKMLILEIEKTRILHLPSFWFYHSYDPSDLKGDFKHYGKKEGYLKGGIIIYTKDKPAYKVTMTMKDDQGNIIGTASKEKIKPVNSTEIIYEITYDPAVEHRITIDIDYEDGLSNSYSQRLTYQMVMPYVYNRFYAADPIYKGL